MSLVLWFTGLSGSGKSTLAEALKKELEAHWKTVEILDGDVIRNTLHQKLGFSREDIRTNNRLIAELAVKKRGSIDFILVPIISPYREDRRMARNIVGKSFMELFVNCPLEECIRKDVKGLYQKALRGEIPNFIGIAPEKPDLTINTLEEPVSECVKTIMRHLSN